MPNDEDCEVWRSIVGAMMMLEDTDAFLRWILASAVLLLASIAVLLAGRR